MAKNPKHYTPASVMDLCSRKRIHSAIDSMAYPSLNLNSCGTGRLAFASRAL